MSQDASVPSGRQSNPLALPLLIISVVAVAEAVGMIFLVAALARRPEAAATASAQTPGSPSAQTPPAVTGGGKRSADQAATPNGTAGGRASGVASVQDRADGRGFAYGKKGERVESAGFGITVEQINHEPAYKSLADWGTDYRYLALLIVVENNTGGNAELLPATFRLQDDQGYPYKQLGLKLTEPKLGITVLGNREKVRGYLDFVVPKTAKGLKLVYWGVPTRSSQPIHVDLGE